MKNITNNKLLEELRNLKQGEKIFINVSKELSDIIKLYDIKFRSYDNLFMSYINNTCEEANKFNLDIFLDRYSKLYFQMEYIKEEILKEALNENYQYFKENNFFYSVDYDLNVLIIAKTIQRGER